jgi:spore coat-associated protein N
VSVNPEAGSVDQADAEAPTRWRVLARNPRRLIIALALIAVAIAVAVFATATFTSSDANAGNLVAAGTLSVDSGDTAILTAENMVPGDTRTGTVTVSNTGSASGNFSMTTQNLQDTPPDPAFSAILTLVVTDVTGGGSTEVYSGKLNAVGTQQLGKWDGGTEHTYRFAVTFPPQGSDAADNAYQGAQTTVDFVWNAVS